MNAADARALLAERIATPPACRICGRPMAPTEGSAAGTVWACHGGDWRTGKWSAFDDQPGRDLADEHYSRSRERVPLAGSYDLASEAVALAAAVIRLEAERDAALAELAADRQLRIAANGPTSEKNARLYIVAPDLHALLAEARAALVNARREAIEECATFCEDDATAGCAEDAKVCISLASQLRSLAAEVPK